MLQDIKPILERTKFFNILKNKPSIKGVIPSKYYEINYLFYSSKPTEKEKGEFYITFVIPFMAYKVAVIDAGFEFKDSQSLEEKLLILREQPNESINNLTCDIEIDLEELKLFTSKKCPDWGKLCYDKIMEIYKKLS